MKTNLPTPRVLALVTLLAASTGCDTIRTTDATGDIASKVGSRGIAGNVYFLPRARVRIQGNYPSKESNDFVIKVERLLEADGKRRLIAAHRSNPLADDTVRFTVNSRGLIDGMFTTMSEDKTGAIIESLAATAINLWKIGAHGATGSGLAVTPQGGPKRALPERLKPFDVTFDPYDPKYHGGFTAGNFTIVVSSIAGEPPASAAVPTTAAGFTKAKAGLVFRAPTIVELKIRRTGIPPAVNSTQQEKKPASPPADGNSGGDKNEAQAAADKATEDAGQAAAAPATNTDLGTPADFSFTAAQLSNEVLSYTLYNADTSISLDLDLALKTPDPRPGAEVPFSFRRAALVKKTTALGFANGELMGIDIRKPSELMAFVKIPQKITTDILAAIPAVIQIKDGRAQRDLNQSLQPDLIAEQRLKAETALISAQTALINAQKANLEAQQALEKAKQAKP
jgi:hypothetical protein